MRQKGGEKKALQQLSRADRVRSEASRVAVRKPAGRMVGRWLVRLVVCGPRGVWVQRVGTTLRCTGVPLELFAALSAFSGCSCPAYGLGGYGYLQAVQQKDPVRALCATKPLHCGC